MTTTIIFIVFLLGVIITLFIAIIILKKRISNLIEKPSLEELMALSIEQVSSCEQTIHPLVLYLYKRFIDKDSVHNFKETHNIILYEDMSYKIEIWSANDVHNRHFYSLSEHTLKSKNKTKEEINNSLTYIDKVILDKICNKIKIDNREFMSRLFI